MAIYRALMEAGKECGAANAGYQAIDSLSIEKGSRHWHMDLRLDDDPLEAGLVFACKLKSPVDFRSALQLKRSKGLNKRINCFTIDHQHEQWLRLHPAIGWPSGHQRILAERRLLDPICSKQYQIDGYIDNI